MPFIQRTLASHLGVQDAAVNLMLHNATVTFDPDITSVSALVETIRGTGYGAEIPAERSSTLAEQAEHDEGQLREFCHDLVRAVDESESYQRHGAPERSPHELEYAST